MSHSFHDALPGFTEGQILVDGCRECEERGEDAFHALTQLDTVNFARAWHRAGQWQLHGLPDVSRAETPLLMALRGAQIGLERFGLPIGELPVRRR